MSKNYLKKNDDLEFYEKVQKITDYKKICDLSFYSQAPRNWSVVVCDIVGSTRAIQEGKYKEINFLGAASIMAIVNSCKDVSLPYVFGGDGATILVPSSLIDRVKAALVFVQKLAKQSYSLHLRSGIVSVEELLEKGFEVQVAKQQLSTNLSTALFAGSGFSEAERLVKSDVTYSISNEENELESESVLDGLECRWEPLRSAQGEILTVLIKAKNTQELSAQKIYQEVIEEIDVICGAKENVSPSTSKNLKLTLDMQKLSVEKRARTFGKNFLYSILYAFKILIEAFMGRILFRFNLRFAGVDWGKYRQEVVTQSDFWKFDDCLRFVFDVKAAQKRALQSCLESKMREGKLYYGLHSSKSALMTCLVFDRMGDHVHFVDGSEGGYAVAASQLKENMKNY